MPEIDPNGAVPPVTPVAKKPSAFWVAAKWLGIGMVSGVAGYEGLRLWKRLKGDVGDSSTELNPSPSGGAFPSAPFAAMPQIMPMPMPMPIPYPMMGQQPAAAAATAPVAADPIVTHSAAERLRKTEERLARMESLLAEYE